MENSYQIPEYLIKLKLIFLEGIKKYHHTKPIDLETITEKLNKHLKERNLLSKKLPSRDIKKLIRWLIKQGSPIGILNGEKYYWANTESELMHSIEQMKAKEFWIQDMINDMEKIQFKEYQLQ